MPIDRDQTIMWQGPPPEWTKKANLDLFGEVVEIVQKGAIFSSGNKYRYRLWRIWDSNKPLVMCIGLNPSNADSEQDDPTITHLKLALKRLGYGGFYMMNLFAFVSSKPKALLTEEDPIGPDYDLHLAEVRSMCSDVIFCWGAFKEAKERIELISPMFPEALCFGKNADGTPSHPLSLMYSGTTNTVTLQKFYQ